MTTTQKQTIVDKMSNVNSLEKFAGVLEYVAKDVLGYKNWYSLTQIKRMAVGSKKRYREFTIPKKSGGVRTITAPSRDLKAVQDSLNKLFQVIYEPSKQAYGFIAGKSVADNAAYHVGQRYIFNIDLKDFFPSIEKRRLIARLSSAPFSFPNEVSLLIAGLACVKTGQSKKSVLPQGSPSSPAFSNIIAERLDRKLNKLANRYGARYSRYADDITFSSMNNIYRQEGGFYNAVCEVIAEEGFVINDNKVRLNRIGERLEITGLTISDKVNVARKYVNDLRWMIYHWERDGYNKAYAVFIKKYTEARTSPAKGTPNMQNVIAGKLDYLKMVKGKEDGTYTKLKKRFDALVTGVPNDGKKYYSTENTSIQKMYAISSYNKYLRFEKYTVDSFSNKYNVVLSFKDDEENTRAFINDSPSFRGYPIYVSQGFKESDTDILVELLQGDRARLFWYISNRKYKDDASYVGAPSLVEKYDDTKAANETPEEIVDVEDSDTNGERDYYNMAVPEWSQTCADVVTAAKRQSDFRLINSTPFQSLAEGDPNYKEAWDKLNTMVDENGKNAYDRIADIELGDEVYFYIDPNVKLDVDPTPILLGTKDGKYFNFFRKKLNSSDEWRGHSALMADIMDEYNSFIADPANSGKVFRFSKHSTVWAKRGGYVQFGPEKSDNPLVKTIGYDNNAPIIAVNRIGKIVVVRGEFNAEKLPSRFVDDISGGGSHYSGNLYYLTRGEDDGYVPIRLNVRHFNKDTQDLDIAESKAVKAGIKKLVEISKNYYTERDRIEYDSSRTADERAQLLRELQEKTDKDKNNVMRDIASQIDVSNILLTFGMLKGQIPTIRLTYYAKEKDEKGNSKRKAIRKDIPADAVTEDEILDFFVNLNKSFQVKLRAKDEGEMKDNIAHINELIERGMVTTNALFVRPKGQDVYINSYNEKTHKFDSEHGIKSTGDIDAERRAADEIVREIPKPAPKKSEEEKKKIRDEKEAIRKKLEVKVTDAEVKSFLEYALSGESKTWGAVRKKLGISAEKASAIEKRLIEEGIIGNGINIKFRITRYEVAKKYGIKLTGTQKKEAKLEAETAIPEPVLNAKTKKYLFDEQPEIYQKKLIAQGYADVFDELDITQQETILKC